MFSLVTIVHLCGDNFFTAIEITDIFYIDKVTLTCYHADIEYFHGRHIP